MSETVKVKPDDMQFDELMVKIRNGQIRIPDFQREFVWDRSQIISLLDSVYQHFPIGSLLFWQTEDEVQSYRRIGEIELRHDSGKSVQYVLDGQQRLTSLFAALEQAKIAHRVNGKKVTKHLQIFFDLDNEVFVADPFSGAKERAASKYVGLPQIKSTDDYLSMLIDLAGYVRAKSIAMERVQEWIMRRIAVSEPDARSWRNRFRVMDLYTVKNDTCTITEAGNELFESRTALPVLRGLVNGFKYFDGILPKVLQDGSSTEDGIVEFYANELAEEVDPWHVRCRLKWLAGLGLGESHERRLVLSEEGKEVIDGVLREIEIRERDLQEQEADKRKRYFSVRQITDLDKLIEAAGVLDKDRKAALRKVSKRFTSYPFSVIYVFDQPIETACEIFERINTSGKVLNVVDLMVAKSWSPTFNLRERLAVFRDELKREHYDDIPDITILQCVAGVIQKSVRRKDILSIKKSEIEESWESVLESVRQALDFLRGNLRIMHAKVLPYNAIVVPLTCFFHLSEAKHHTNEVRNTLVTWFWQASVSNRYDASAETKIGDDIAEMAKLAAGDKPDFNYVAPPLVAERIVAQRLNLGSAFCKTILCVLNSREPRELKDSAPVLLTSFSKFNAAELHHIFPQSYLRRHDKGHYPDRDSMANIALARAAANKEYSNKAPSRYIRDCGNPKMEEVLFSHFVDDKDPSGILEDDFESFVQYRAERILDEMRRLTGRMTEVEADFKGNEAKAIEKFELRMRSLLNSTLRKIAGDYWQNTGSPEFRHGIEDRIAGWLKANPGRKRNEAREVDFCQILEYLKIARAHWKTFEPIFRSRSDLEAHLKNVNNFRNALMHNREIDLATQQLALGSLSWFGEVFRAAGV
jgi:hypothetical protein